MVRALNLKLAGGWACLLLTVLLQAGATQAQEYDSLIAKYKKEDAVIINYTEHLVITNDAGKLVATSYITKDKLFVTDLARGIYNTDYLFHSDFHALTDLKAVAMIPGNKGYRKVNCYNFAEVNPDREQVFYDDNRLIVVSYSGLQKNAVTHTSYAIEHTDLHLLPSFSFQENIPVDKASFEVTVPKTVNMKFALTGNDSAMIVQTVEEKTNTITYKFTVANVPAYKEFDHVPSVWYYLTQVIPYITSYKLSESGKKVDMLANTDQLYKYLYKYVRNLNMKEDTLLSKTVEEITKGDITPRDKAVHIYQWVQNNLHYIAFEKGLEGFVPREASLVIRRKYGDCKDMAGTLVTMCRKAGLEAYYTWIGTRAKPYRYNATPLPLVNNHMICALKLGDEWIFMDGTHPYIPFGQYPDGIQGKEAMVAIDEKNYKIIEVPVASANKNVTVDSTRMSFSENMLKGTIKQQYKGTEAWSIGISKMYMKSADWDKHLRTLTARGSDKYHNNSQKVATSKNAGKDATIETDFEIPDYVRTAGRQCFINMNLKRTFEDSHIDPENRNVPVFYNNKRQAKEVVVLDIPKGYKLTHLPPAAHGSVDGLWNYKITYTANKNKITLVKEYELTTLTASPKLFAGNNKMVDDLKKLYKESVVLTAN
jgi:hypothetical protein